MAEGFIFDLIGYHDVRKDGGSLLPRRNVLNFPNGLVNDNSATRETDLTFFQDYTPTLVAPVAGTQLASTGKLVYRVSTAVTLFGLDEPSLSEPLLIYGINASSGSITLENESASATAVAARWRTADALDKVIAPNGIWIALHDRQINRWRVL